MGRVPGFEERCATILSECERALGSIDALQVEELLRAVQDARRVFFIGVGRVMLSLEAIAKRFAHCGIDAVCVGQITEPAITRDDLLIVASGSGESLIPVAISAKAKKCGARVALIGSNPESTIAGYADCFLRIPVATKLNRADELKSKQPMTSLFEQSLLLLGDAMAGMIIERRDLDLEQLWQYHANLE